MTVEPVLTLIVLAVVANLVVMAAVLVPPLVGRRGATDIERADAALFDSSEPPLGVPEGSDPVTGSDVPTWAYDRVVRVASWVFVAATAAIVAFTGLWPDTEQAIFVLLAVVSVFILLVHDLLPSAALGVAKFLVEGSVAITFATLLVMFTGRDGSPFFFVFPLIVGGAALVVSQRVTLGLAIVASLGYLVAIFAGSSQPITTATIATIAINLIALVLLAYVAMGIASEQRRARDAAIRLSTVDPLTGLFNRTYFFAAIDREIARSARSGRGFCLLMMDLDELKSVNDRHGHFVGDRVLAGVGQVIRDGVRRIDTAARYGGDEFVVVLPETDASGAYVLAEKIRLGAADLALSDVDVRTSLSVGVVSYPDNGSTSDALMISADQAMYASKRSGKNRVMGLKVRGGGRATGSV